MPEGREYYVYIMTNVSRTLYIGVTSDLLRRVFEHKGKQFPGFTRRYNLTMLAYFESTDDVSVALAREKELKGWRRSKKVALIESMNPGWLDLAADWYSAPPG
jgi:putative endonuclease